MPKNLLFDLGGVIVDICRENCVDAFIGLGLQDADKYFGLYAQTGIFMAIEDGSATKEEFRDFLRPLLSEGTTDAQIDEAFQKFIIGVPRHRLEALRQLRDQGYKIYLLSNTNPIMWSGVLAREFTAEGMCREDYFDGMVTSFEAKCAKPDPKIFRYTIEKLGIDPSDTLFFDDGLVNVEAARAEGFQAVHVLPNTEFTDYLPR